MYSRAIWDHLNDPRNRRRLEGAQAVGDSRFPKCNDHLIVQLRIEDDRILEAAFLAKACGPVVAVASLACEMVVQLTLEQARELTWIQLDLASGRLPAPKRHALWLFLEALHNALDHYSQAKAE